MTVLEFAIFTLRTPHTPSSPTSPNTIYLIGAWDSVPAHNSFLASDENQKLLADAKGVIDVDVMYHAEMDGGAVPLGAPVVSVGRHHVKRGMKTGFEGCFGRVRGVLSGSTGAWEVAGGWRLDEGEGEEKGQEWLLFTGWESVTQHEEFGRSEKFKEYAEIREFLEGFEVRHAVRYDI
ncbi:unnamed protein product [Tuber aestivum]|uniref:ABM domain-containing protein n=1 Tax=Tuber aestivum TaxID=59557 RepID=A0A292PRP6_9PEZI|nr:unnamed protein product [Tuber aestivum]